MAPSTSIHTFHTALSTSPRILCLLGAGLSASSGLQTFRGKGGFWRDHDATVLATPEAFAADPGLIWQKRGGDLMVLSQNVDGLSFRAGHPESTIRYLHGSLFDVKCVDDKCGHFEKDNFKDPLCPALEILPNFSDSKDDEPRYNIKAEDLPHCPKCKTNLLRPGVTWFGETLPKGVLEDADKWIDIGKVDLMLVIGTSAAVWPAAGYIEVARGAGARIAVVNMVAPGGPERAGFEDEDWMFKGDAATLVPEMLRPAINKDYTRGDSAQ